MNSHSHVEQILRRLNVEPRDLIARPSLAQLGPEWEPIQAELHSFLAQVAHTLRTLDSAIGTMGVKEALNLLQIREMTRLLAAQTEEVERLTSGIEELAQGVTRVAADTHEAARAAAKMQEQGGQGLDAITQVLHSVQALEGDAQAAHSSFLDLVKTTRQTAEGLQLIRGVADTSRLLALNAAIQAAHANDRAFGVIAQEVRRLSDRTAELVRRVEGQVSGLDGAIGRAAAAMEGMASSAALTRTQATQANRDLVAVQSLIANVNEAVQSIAAVAQEQAAATEEMSATTENLKGTLRAAADSIALTRNLTVTEVAESAHEVLGGFYIDSRSDRMRQALAETALRVEETVERLVDQRAVGLAQLWDTEYREIKGARIASLGRIFRVDRVPPGGFSPRKYETAYDQAIDLPLIDLMDQAIAAHGFQFCTVLDLNVFVIAHGRNMCADWTGDYEQDLRTNRIKRLITTDANARRGSRVGLPTALVQKELVAAADVERLPVPKGNRPFILQTYALDSGDVVLAMAMPLFIRGRRWATIRIGFAPEA